MPPRIDLSAYRDEFSCLFNTEQEWRSDQEHYDVELVPPTSRSLLPEDSFSDPDVFAMLLPVNKKARHCIRMSENKNCYVAFQRVETEIGSRDPTPAPDVPPWEDLDHLVLRFSDIKTNQWTIGRDRSCEIVFKATGVSLFHCNIVAKDDGFYIEDISTYGTAVAYDCETTVLQKSGKWLIAPKPGEPLPWARLTLQVGHVCMNMVLPNHSSCHPTYLENFLKLAQAGQDAWPAMTRLDLRSHSSTIALGTPNHMQPDMFRQDPSSGPSTGSDIVNQEARGVAIFNVMGQYSDLNTGMVGQGRSDALSLALEKPLPFVCSDITYLQPIANMELLGENGWDRQLPKRTDVANLESKGKVHLQAQTTERQPDCKQHTSWVPALGRNDKLGTMEMVFENHVVSMRMSDGFLSATDIMRSAQITKAEKDAITRLFKKNVPDLQRSGKARQSQIWVPFTDGYFLCKDLGLQKTLLPLLDYGKKNKWLRTDRNNYFLSRRPRRSILDREQERLITCNQIFLDGTDH